MGSSGSAATPLHPGSRGLLVRLGGSRVASQNAGQSSIVPTVGLSATGDSRPLPDPSRLLCWHRRKYCGNAAADQRKRSNSEGEAELHL